MGQQRGKIRPAILLGGLFFAAVHDRKCAAVRRKAKIELQFLFRLHTASPQRVFHSKMPQCKQL